MNKIYRKRGLVPDFPATRHQQERLLKQLNAQPSLFDSFVQPAPPEPPAAQPLSVPFIPPKKPVQSVKSGTQAKVILDLLRHYRELGKPLPLPKILELNIGQYTPRLFELRAAGFKIVNHMEHSDDGIHSEYELTYDPELDDPAEEAAAS